MPILSLVTFLPLVGAAIIFFTRGDEEMVARNARAIALWTSLITFVVSLWLWFGFDPNAKGFQFEERAEWLPSANISYHMGIDGLSMLFIILTTFLLPLCVLASWDAIHTRVKEYMISFLVLETLVVGTFCALDLILFYMFFEGMLIPMFLIIGVWGGARRVYSAFKFFLYTLLGSVLMLLAILAIYFQTGSTDIVTLRWARILRRSCKRGCGWRFSPRSRSRCRCGRSTPGCQMRMSRRRLPDLSSWRAFC